MHSNVEVDQKKSSHEVINVETYIPTSSATMRPYWMKDLKLREDGKEIILNGNWLTDKHISAMNKLLKKQHPQQNGLTDTICLSEQSRWNSNTNNYVQVVNVSGNHWICTANIEILGVVKAQ